ncbi:hypothetical protein, partial [Streptomyces thermolineatus]|uniref:hypothetical protein n=1 Tax=Streptomyces thermolineatus TaxID=44033 RepID=UPI0031CFCC69
RRLPELPGVFYSLALTFGTLLSSQGTEASFETFLSVSPGFPFGVSDSIRSDFRFVSPDRFQVGAAFRLLVAAVVPTYWTPAPGGKSRRARVLTCRRPGQTSTTTGRIIGLRR